MARKLSALAVSAIRTPGLHSVGDGLYIKVLPNSRSWVYRYMSGGKAHKVGLGPYPVVTLAQAREKAADAQRLRARGQDPLAVKRDSTPVVMTFKRAAEDYIDAKKAGWRNDGKSAAQWSGSLQPAYRKFGTLPVASIKASHIVAVLRPIWNRTPESAARLRGRIENVLDYAIAHGSRDSENPARIRILKHLLPQQRREKGHFAAMPHAEVAEFMRALKGEQGVGAIALRFVILTAARSGEVRGMTWDEVDLDAKVWTVPATRMKAGTVHRVPLSEPALALLRPLKELGRGPLVFEGMKRNTPMSDMTLTATLRRMGCGYTAHGFRSSFRDWCGDVGQPREIAELALAHKLGNAVEQAYFRSDVFARRVKLMDDWGSYCCHE